MAAGDATDIPIVRALLRTHVGDDGGEVEPLSGGFHSRAYACAAGGCAYVVRLSDAVSADEGFAKDDYAFQHFVSPALPIPRISASGMLDDTAYAIGERLPGRTLAECSPAERRTLLPAVLDTLEAIAAVDTSGSYGYGPWGADGNGSFSTWQEFLVAAIDDVPQGYYADWHSLFHDSFLERDAFEKIYQGMLRMLPFCPVTRALIHNDFQFENILVQGRHVSGVIDWANAVYGDPLYDVARLIAWSAQPDWWYDDGPALLHARFGAATHYAERIACYRCHLGLDDLRFYAKTGNRPTYEFFRDQLLALVATLPS